MTQFIPPVGPSPASQPGKPAPGPRPAEGERSFSDILKDSIDKVNQLQVEADLSVEKLADGKATEDDVMVAFKKAQLSFEALTQIRNKLVEAFDELQRMRI